MSKNCARRNIAAALSLGLGLSLATLSASANELEQKLFDVAANDPLMERQVTQLITRLERGQVDQVTQSTIQQFFQVAPDGELSADSLERARKQAVAAARARFLGRYLAYDLDGNGAISKAEMDGLHGNEASQIVSLRSTSDLDNDGEISAEELWRAANEQANTLKHRRHASYLMAFDLDENGIVVVDELLKGLRMLAGEAPDQATPESKSSTTSGSFVAPSELNDPVPEQATDADGLPVELHMVGIYEPRKSRGEDGLSRTEAVKVMVDRPGASVVLALGSYRPTRWVVETSEDTQVSKIIMSDRNRPRGEVLLNGQKVSVTYRDLPLAYKSQGNRFQPFHEAAARAAGTSKAASFQGSYKAPEGGFVVGDAPGIETQAEFEAALMAAALKAEDLSPKLRSAFEGKTKAQGAYWTLRDEGFVGVDETGAKILHKLPLEAPEVSWPMGAAYDPEHQRIWGVTLGGEGFLYTYDVAKNQWSARSMNNVDAGGLIYDPRTETLITTPGPHGRSGYLTLDMTGKEVSRLKIALSEYPGLISTFDPGNGPSPRIVPIMIDGDQLLVSADPWPRPQRKSRLRWTYLVDLQTGKVRLVR